MYMAADSNMNFQHGAFPLSFCNQYMGSFQSGTAGLVQRGINCSGGINSRVGMVLPGNTGSLNNESSLMLEGNSNGCHNLDLIAGLKHDTGLAADWSFREQSLLNHGLIKYAELPSILKYIKIAAVLPEKSVRDVALRSRWMSRKENGKRRRLEEYYAGKKCKDKKEKVGDLSMMATLHPFGSTVGYPFMMHHVNSTNNFLGEAPLIDNASRQLLEENKRVLGQIASNLETAKIQDNVNLFLRTRNNITAILNSMSEMPGIMSQMPPLPVTITEDLVTTILPTTNQFTKWDCYEARTKVLTDDRK